MVIMLGPIKINVYQRVLAQLLILLVAVGSLAALTFLTTQTLSCMRHIAASPEVNNRVTAGNNISLLEAAQ